MGDPFVLLLIGMVIVIGGIIGLKLHPFLAMILAAFVVAVLTPTINIEQFGLAKGMSPESALKFSKLNTGERVATEFGNTCGKIGVMIALAAIIGKCLLESGAAERIIRSILQLAGIEKAPASFLVSSFFIGIPVFFDTVMFLMMPLVKAMTVRLGKNYLLLLMCIYAGAAMANSLVPPAPGPLFLISELQIPIGMMMLCGVIVGMFTITAGYFFSVWVNKKMPIELRDSVDAKISDIQHIADRDLSLLPSLGMSLLPLIIPLICIGADTFFSSYLNKVDLSGQSFFPQNIMPIIKFVGNKNTAILLGAIAALWVVVRQRKGNNEVLSGFVQAAILSGGGIILITAAGGAFGAMLQQTGISAKIANLTSGYQLALIPLAFLIAAVVRTAQGSATVSLITASGILSGMALHTDLGFHPVYIGLAIGCGSKLVPWMNDSGFWIICRLSNLTEKEGLKTITPLLAIMGLTGLIVIMIGAKIFPLV